MLGDRIPGRRKRGQTIPIIALILVVLIAFAGLAIDGVHVYLVRRQAQNAADAAALAGGKWLIATGGLWSAPPHGTDKPVTAAHDLAGINGFTTILDSSCDAWSPTSFTTTWVDAGGCRGNGFSSKVTVNSPPHGSLPPDCVTVPYNCIQVTVTSQFPNYLMGVLGIPTSTVAATATVLAQPPSNAFPTPPPVALYLYEPPAAACAAPMQCYDPTRAASRVQLNCVNCPTFWSRPNAGPVIGGLNGKLLASAADQPALQANGDMLIQDNTTICDPYGGATCAQGVATGAMGFGLAGGAKLYCSGFGGGSANGLTGCTTSGPSPLGRIYGNEVGFTPETWSPNVDTSNLPHCGALVLNGDTVSRSLGGADAACYPPSSEPYLIMPGIYTYIVVNHGAYEFQAGLYDITAVAPQSAISHGHESSADYDLCAGVAGCTASAGIWIGYGSNGYVPGSSGGSNCLGSPGSGGGGDATNVTGSSVSFRFESTSSGFVSTHEVQSVRLTAPGVGASKAVNGVPLLFDVENPTATVHLDAAPPANGKASGYTGVVYQTKNATGGGVEINPGLGGSKPALSGQVLAYSFNTFGSRGPALDFSQGYGTASAPVISSGGFNETSILTAETFADLGNGVGRLTLQYADEWALDAYDAYVKINGGNPIFFSQGIWTSTPQTPPPAVNVPGDSNPAYPAAAQDVNNQYAKTVDVNGLPDWTYKLADGSTFEVTGNWTWGHERSISGAQTASNTATLIYTFTAPPGSTIDVLVFMTDGDRCGDYVSADKIFNNVSNPQAGQQSAGGVLLIS
ncbi:MAG TPA: pilus assembly protein TadG-related protein [Candidatus Limnocylindrales bacterium]|nr:pilus assembly protein TadG-related protein [Candidatus Limnocylindrales bacterium]